MNTYKIKTTSWTLWILTLLIIFFSGVILAHNILPKNPLSTIASVILIMSFALFVQRFISLGIVIINLSNTEISITWIKQYIFHKKPNRKITLSEIESYKYQPDQNFDLFKLNLKDGSEIRLWHFTFTAGDDFDKLITDFPSIVSHHNQNAQAVRHAKNQNVLKNEIKAENTIFESDAAPFLAILAIVMIIAFLLILYFNTSKNPLIMLGPIGGATFFLIQFFKYRKNNRSEL